MENQKRQDTVTVAGAIGVGAKAKLNSQKRRLEELRKVNEELEKVNDRLQLELDGRGAAGVEAGRLRDLSPVRK